MSFGKLFSKEGRAELRAKQAYADCQQWRAAKMRLFRDNARKEVNFLHPGSVLATNDYSSRFMFLDDNQQRLYFGELADHFLPKLDFVSDWSNVDAINRAVEKFVRDIKTCRGHIALAYEKTLRNISRYISGQMIDEFRESGYAVTGSLNANWLIGGALFLNDERIAYSTFECPAPKGYFSKAILEAVSRNYSFAASTQSLSFVTATVNPMSETTKVIYDVIFDPVLHRLNLETPNQFTRSIIELRDLTASIERYFSPDLPSDDPSKAIYASDLDPSLFGCATLGPNESWDLYPFGYPEAA